MKKTLVSLLVSGLAATAYAAPVYQQDGATLDVYGRFGASFDKSEQTKIDLKDDGSRFGFKVNYDLGNQLEALGAVEFRFSGEDGRFSDPTTHSAYAGLKHAGIGTLTLGRQATTADELALSKYAYRREDVTMLPVKGDRTIKFRSAEFGSDETGRVSFGVDYTFLGSNDKHQDVKSQSIGTGLFYTYKMGDVGFKLNGGYSQTRLGTEFLDNLGVQSLPTKNTNKAWIVGSEITYDKFALAFDYSHSDTRGKDLTTGFKTPSMREHGFQVAAKYAVTPETNLFTSYQYVKEKTTDDGMTLNDKYQQFTVGADYKLHKNVVTYAQVDVIKTLDKNTNEKSSDVGGAIGLRVLF